MKSPSTQKKSLAPQKFLCHLGNFLGHEVTFNPKKSLAPQKFLCHLRNFLGHEVTFNPKKICGLNQNFFTGGPRKMLYGGVRIYSSPTKKIISQNFQNFSHFQKIFTKSLATWQIFL
jgi:hypothetical protein